MFVLKEEGMAGWIIAVIVVIISGIVIWNIKKDSTSQNQPVVPVANSRQQSSQPTMLSTRIETGPMVYYANDTHGATDKEYRFNYKKVNGAWRAYILRMPSLGNRDARSIPTHRLWDDDNKPYICWNSSVTSLKDMQNISRVWADSIQEYIATGKRFGPE